MYHLIQYYSPCHSFPRGANNGTQYSDESRYFTVKNDIMELNLWNWSINKDVAHYNC